MHDLDRFDRLLLAGSAPRAAVSAVTPPASSSVLAGAPTRPVVRAHPPAEVDHITSKRGSRYVDHAACPLCGAARVGVEFHGVLMSGAKVHELAAHSPGYAMVRHGLPRCMASKGRMVFLAGCWVSEQKL